MSGEGNDGPNYGKDRGVIIYRLNELSSGVKGVRDEVRHIDRNLQLLSLSVERLQTRANAWGALAGALAGGVVAIAVALILKGIGA